MRPNRPARLGACFAAVLVAGAPAADARARPLDDVVASGTLRVAVYRDNPPFAFRRDGTLVGIDVDLGRKIADALGVAVAYMEIGADETMDDDLRNAVWKGHYLGGGVADLMLNVPYDRDFGARNPQVALFAPYAVEQFALASDPGRLGEGAGLVSFRRTRIGVEVDSLPDFYLSSAMGGVLRESVVHFPSVPKAVDALLAAEVGGVMATRSSLEAALGGRVRQYRIEPTSLKGFGRSRWPIGIAVKEDSRDLGYASEDVVAGLAADGGLAGIYAAYGATWTAPAAP